MFASGLKPQFPQRRCLLLTQSGRASTRDENLSGAAVRGPNPVLSTSWFEAQGALTCREQKFSCPRLATDNSQYRGDDQMRTLLLGGLLASAMLVPALAQTSPPPASPAPAAQSTA